MKIRWKMLSGGIRRGMRNKCLRGVCQKLYNEYYWQNFAANSPNSYTLSGERPELPGSCWQLTLLTTVLCSPTQSGMG